MCFFDAEPCEFYEESHHTARKPKECSVCRWMIPAGAPYVKYAWKYEGDFNAAQLCLGCHLLIEDFGSAHRGSPTPDWFIRALTECYDEADKTDPDAKRWRDAMAEILWRGRRGLSDAIGGAA